MRSSGCRAADSARFCMLSARATSRGRASASAPRRWQIPSTIHYDLWCGPAEKKDLYRPKLHYDWHWDWNTGNGDMGNQGIHQMDIARWFLGEPALAPRVISIGGRLGYEDAGNTPNTQVVYLAYEKAPLIFETRGLPRSKAAQAKWGDSMDEYRGSRRGRVGAVRERPRARAQLHVGRSI